MTIDIERDFETDTFHIKAYDRYNAHGYTLMHHIISGAQMNALGYKTKDEQFDYARKIAEALELSAANMMGRMLALGAVPRHVPVGLENERVMSRDG